MKVLITDAHEWAGLGAIRSLGRAGHRVTAGYPKGIKPPPSIYSRYCTDSVSYPDPWAYQFEFINWLKNELSSNKYEVFLPTTEATVIAASAIRGIFENKLVIMMPTDDNLRYTLSKYNSPLFADKADIPIPKTVFVKNGVDATSWNDNLDSLKFPVVIKSDNYLTQDGIYIKGSRTIVNSLQEAIENLSIYKELPTNVIAQEYVEGYGLAAFILRFNNNVILRFAHKRVHEIPYSGGYSSLRESIKDQNIISYAEKMLDMIDYQGLAMVEFRRGRNDQIPYFLEINGRLWGSIALALHTGVDFPLRSLECYTGIRADIEQTNYKEGILCRNTLQGKIRHLRSVFEAHNRNVNDAPSRFIKILEFLYLTLNPFVKHDHLWYSDPKPFLMVFKYTMSDYFPGILKHLDKT